jgi:opacity protein-like surface antigen
LSFRQTVYDGRATALETRDRKDDRLSVGADISYAITPAWNLEASYRYIDNDSRSELYEYDRHVVNIGMAWKF